MKTIIAIALAAATLAGCTAPSSEPEMVERTVRETCQLREKAEADYQNVRFKSLAGAYGVSRKAAQKEIAYWSDFCSDGHYAAYKAEQQPS